MENLIPLRIACILILGGLAQAQTNPDLYDMPTAENVFKNVMGSDNIDTYAKQRAALYLLWDIAI